MENVILDAFVGISTGDDGNDPDTQFFDQNLYQNLSKFDTVK